MEVISCTGFRLKLIYCLEYGVCCCLAYPMILRFNAKNKHWKFAFVCRCADNSMHRITGGKWSRTNTNDHIIHLYAIETVCSIFAACGVNLEQWRQKWHLNDVCCNIYEKPLSQTQQNQSVCKEAFSFKKIGTSHTYLVDWCSWRCW